VGAVTFALMSSKPKKERESAKKKNAKKAKAPNAKKIAQKKAKAPSAKKKREFTLFSPPTIEIRFQSPKPHGRGKTRVLNRTSKVG
jgi:hypothetical protein